MNIKKHILIILLVLFGSLLYGQRIGLQFGGVMTGLQQSVKNVGQGDFSLLTGAIGGPEIEFRLTDKWGINSGAFFEFRAGRYDISWYKPGTTCARILYYAQTPLHLTYRKSLKKKGKLMYFTGPRLNIGLFGEISEHYYLASLPKITEENPFGGNHTLHRMDVMYDLGIGLEINRFQFKLNYGFPVTNNANVSDHYCFRQHQLQLSVGITLRNFKDKKKEPEAAESK